MRHQKHYLAYFVIGALLFLGACDLRKTEMINADTPKTNKQYGVKTLDSDTPNASPMLTPLADMPESKARRRDGRIAIGMLLPLGSEDKEIRFMAESLFNAAQLALFDLNRADIIIIVKDTKGTPEGAKVAAIEILQEDISIAIGPLFGSSLAAVTPLLRGREIPIISFSNDKTAVSRGSWLIGFLPEQNMERIIIEAITYDYKNFAALLPNDVFGKRVYEIIKEAIPTYGGKLTDIEIYESESEKMFAPAQKISKYKQRRAEHAKRKQELFETAQSMVPQDTPQNKVLDVLKNTAPEIVADYRDLERKETYGELPYDSIILPEGGLALRSLAPLLPYFDVDPRKIKFLGSGLWDDPALGQEPPLRGGWFAAPDPAGWAFFEDRYKRAYQDAPSRIASLAYDAVGLIGALLTIDPTDPFRYELILDENGFKGVDGIFRFKENGLNERGLAVLEVGSQQSKLISPAPQSFVDYENYYKNARVKQHIGPTSQSE